MQPSELSKTVCSREMLHQGTQTVINLSRTWVRICCSVVLINDEGNLFTEDIREARQMNVFRWRAAVVDASDFGSSAWHVAHLPGYVTAILTMSASFAGICQSPLEVVFAINCSSRILMRGRLSVSTANGNS